MNYDQTVQPTPADIWTQVDELRTQIAVQQEQLARLQVPGRKRRSAMDQPGRLFATFESVLVQPVQSNGTGVIVQTDDGYSHVTFPWKIEHSPRVQFGEEALGETLGWRLRLWEFRHSEGFSADDANGLLPIPYEATAGYFIENGDVLTGLEFITEGTFTSQIRANVIDFEVQRKLASPLDLYAGLRYAKIAQGYRAVTDQGNISGHSEFRGIGPTLAMRATHVLPLERLQLFANLRGSMLFGAKDFSAVDDVNNLRQSMGELSLRSGDDYADTFVTNAELQLGIRYAICKYFALSVALEGQHYANVGGPNPTAVFTGIDGGINGDRPLDDSLSFLGLSVTSEFIW